MDEDKSVLEVLAPRRVPLESSHSSFQADPILSSLQIPTTQRTKRDLIPIIDFIKSLKFFHSFSAYPETVEQIASRIELETYHTGSHVFHEGEPGHHFYIILEGEIAIMKKKRFHSLMDIVTENILLVKLGCGQYFGENALDNKSGLRTATALAHKRCYLLALHRDDYQLILYEFKQLSRIAIKKAFSSPSSIFRHLHMDIIEQLSQVSVVRSYSPNAEIFTAGTNVNSFMIIKSGVVKLIKPISKADFRHTMDDINKKLSLPEVKNYSKSTSPEHSHEMQVDVDGDRPASPWGSKSSSASPRSPKPSTPQSRRGMLSHHSHESNSTTSTDLPDVYSKSNNERSNSKILLTQLTSESPVRVKSLTSAATPTRTPRFQSPRSETRKSSKSASNTPRANSNRSTMFVDHYSPSSTPTTSRSGTKQIPNNANLHQLFAPVEERDDPMGFWVLSRSDEYLNTTKPMKIVTRDSNGKTSVTQMNREAYTKANSQEFTVAVLMPGQVLGEICVLDPEQTSPLTAVAVTMVEVFCIDSELLLQFGIRKDDFIMHALLDDWKFRNPPKQEIQKQMKAKCEWNFKKDRIMNDFYKKML